MKKIIFALLIAFCLATPSWAKQKPDLAHAIAYAEGYYVKGSKSWRNHNPGNIRRGMQYIHFRNDREGFAALYALLRKVAAGESRFYNVNMTLKDFGKVYADGHGIWAKNVAKMLKVEVTTRMWELLDAAPSVKIPVTMKPLDDILRAA